ncbi:universal stress protein [Candidatus Neomarinimicrobiota bacterium]
MKFYKRILFPTDFSECADAAYEYALLIAKMYNAELHVFFADVRYLNPFDLEFEITTDIQIDFKQSMDKYELKYGISYDKIKKTSIKGYATAPCIIDYIKKEQIDLIIMGTHGRRGIRHMLLGSVTEEVLKTTPCNIITIRKDHSVMSVPKHILIPTDYSDQSLRAVSEGYNIAQKFSAVLTLLHVIEKPIPAAYYLAGDEETIDQFYELTAKDAKKKLDDINKDAGIRLNYKIKVIKGHVASSITKYASDNKVDLIVMGSHGHTGLTHFLLGSTTDKVVRSTTCPVMIVKRDN